MVLVLNASSLGFHPQTNVMVHIHNPSALEMEVGLSSRSPSATIANVRLALGICDPVSIIITTNKADK